MAAPNITREEALRVAANRLALVVRHLQGTHKMLLEHAPDVPNVSAETLENLEQVAYFVSWAAQGRFPATEPHLRGLARL